MIKPEVILIPGIECELGEGLHWDRQRQLLWLVDVIGQQVISMDPQSQEVTKRQVPEPIGWVISVEDSDLLLVGLKSGIALIHAFDHNIPLTWLDKSFPGNSTLRMNDAKLDRFGLLWCGSMSTLEAPGPVGALARYSISHKSWTLIDRGYVIPNGPAFNCDASLALHNDSAERITYRYLLNAESGEISGRTIWKKYLPEDGLPDGMTFDSEGFVWIAHWGIGEIRRYDPSGEIQLAIPIPTPYVTNVCFGGHDMRRLFVTSAGYSLGKGIGEPDTYGGKLFEVKGLEVKGLHPLSARLESTYSGRYSEGIAGGPF